MKKAVLIIFFLIGLFNSAKAQLPMGTYGPYYFVTNYDHNGEEMEVKGFDKISVCVVTTGFFGIIQSGAFYSYNFAGQYQQSGTFDYQGISDGWYVYSFYNQQLLISRDRERVLFTNPYGGMSLYAK